MPHFVSLALFVISTLIIFAVFYMLIELDAKAKARKRCMMNHPAGKLAKIEPSLFGETEENFRKRYQGGYQPTDLLGD